MIPRKLNILGREWSIRRRKLQGICAECDYDKNRIDYAPGMVNSERRDAVLHEVMHAVRHMQGHEYGGEVEEDYVRSLATGLIGVLDANPRFALWLLDKD